MGYLRLILAYMVVYGHVYYDGTGLNLGIVAVVVFLIISGYVMTALISKHYRDPRQVLSFYADRALRLAPQFYLYLALTALLAGAFGLRHPFMAQAPSAASLFAQAMVLPLDFGRSASDMLLPQAWSLGLEASFYLVVPFILMLRVRGPVAWASAAIFAAGMEGVLDLDLWSYRFLPGTLVVFMLGSWLREHPSKADLVGGALFMAFVVVSALAPAPHAVPQDYLAERASILIGLIAGVPLVLWVSKAGTDGPRSALAGDLSYGVFLSHNLLFGIFVTYLDVPAGGSAARRLGMFVAIAAASTLLGYASFKAVEEPFLKLRRSMRTRRAAARVRTAAIVETMNVGTTTPARTGDLLIHNQAL